VSELRWRIYQLKRQRWQLLNRGYGDPEVTPAAVDWLDGQIAEAEREETRTG